ncbi:protein mono-ADP-ribosyltransferase PARP9-like [Haliotis rubra]|uniref:protein mono-ADP-ribosyltransferase PARP9-like n=1 Tax=Haliotis rubra TaxID=36100 RepID=UPI001EE5E187|nr:protein mono-ADP-ribosyltransferase PARP9-like [Haliotis rubra]
MPTVAKAFFETILYFVNNTSNISLTLVRVVIHPSNDTVIQAFETVKTNFAQELTIASSLDKVPVSQVKPQPQPQASNVAVEVSQITGDIEKQTTDVIVNTTNPGLNLADGVVSKVMLEAAGDDLQDECKTKYPSGVKAGEVAVTGGGNLSCKQVYHITLTDCWSSDQPGTEKLLRGTILKCLKTADDAGLTSLSFPALGTGKLKYDPARVAELMYSVCLSFRSKGLNKVILVMHASSPGVKQAFETVKTNFAQELTIASSLNKVPVPQVKPQPQPQASNVAVVVSQITGDIEKQTTDVIVNTTNPGLNLADGVVSKVMLEAAGDDLQDECKTKYPSGVKAGEVAVTGGGNLSCKQVYHITLTDGWSSDQPGTEKVCCYYRRIGMSACLKTADDAGLTSLSFPALGTGKLKYDPARVAELMYSVCLSFRSKGLNKVILVMHASSPGVKQVQSLIVHLL